MPTDIDKLANKEHGESEVAAVNVMQNSILQIYKQFKVTDDRDKLIRQLQRQILEQQDRLVSMQNFI